MAIKVNMPRLSDTMEEGTVAQWLKNVGDKINEGDILAEIETDKATMEFESFNDGVLLHIGIEKGDTAPVDSLLAIIGEKGEDITDILNRVGIEEGSAEEVSEGNKKDDETTTEEDYIYYVKTFMEKILNDIVIRGVKHIQKVNLRKIHGYKHYEHETGNYNKKDIYVLDTIGTNLIDTMALKDIDVTKTFSNDIMEMYSVLGIEAARKCLFNEIIDVMEFDSTYINHHHMHLLCDRMACNEKMVSIFRHGINTVSYTHLTLPTIYSV